MQELFQIVLGMSLTGSVVIPAVCVLRLFLKKAPRRFSFFLWGIPAFRLLCPVSFSAGFSLFSLFPESGAAVLPLSEGTAAARESLLPRLAAALWAAGAAAILGAALIAGLRTRRRVKDAVLWSGNSYECEVSAPFVMGVLRPRIYFPFGLTPEQRKVVLCHETCHIRRGDPAVKLLAFFILAVHWFNPLVWAAFFLMERDMEMSCDEKALEMLGGESRRRYSLALLSLAEHRKAGSLPVPSFGGAGVKARVKNVMTFRKPGKCGSVLAAALCVLGLAVCVSDPVPALPEADFLAPVAELRQSAETGSSAVSSRQQAEFFLRVLPSAEGGGTRIMLLSPEPSAESESVSYTVTAYPEPSAELENASNTYIVNISE